MFILFLLSGQQHLVPVLLCPGQRYWAALAHPGPQRTAERQAGPGRPAAEPNPAVLPVCQQQQPELSTQLSASRTQAAATGPQPDQQHQPHGFQNLHNLTLLLLQGNKLQTITEGDLKGSTMCHFLPLYMHHIHLCT